MRTSLLLLVFFLASCAKDDLQCPEEIQDAATNGDVQQLADFLDDDGNIDCRGEWHQTLLIKAIQSGHPAAAKFLIQHDADSSIPTDEGDLAIHRAARSGQLDVFRLLVNDSNVNTKGRLGMTPLMYAANQEHLAVVQEAVSMGADVNDQSDSGYTPLSYTSSPDVAEYLLSAGADPYLENYRGHNALENARDHIERVREFSSNPEDWSKYQQVIDVIERWAANQ